MTAEQPADGDRSSSEPQPAAQPRDDPQPAAQRHRAEPSASPVRLRGHHFVCLQFFGGQGYSAAFVENLKDVVAHASSSPALLVEGADDVCVACPGLASDGLCVDPDAGEPEVRRLDALAFRVLGADPGDRLSLADARSRLADNAVGVGHWRSDACDGCVWEHICETGWNALLDEVDTR
jgi:uncharacterized protein